MLKQQRAVYPTHYMFYLTPYICWFQFMFYLTLIISFISHLTSADSNNRSLSPIFSVYLKLHLRRAAPVRPPGRHLTNGPICYTLPVPTSNSCCNAKYKSGTKCRSHNLLHFACLPRGAGRSICIMNRMQSSALAGGELSTLNMNTKLLVDESLYYIQKWL